MSRLLIINSAIGGQFEFLDRLSKVRLAEYMGIFSGAACLLSICNYSKVFSVVRLPFKFLRMYVTRFRFRGRRWNLKLGSDFVKIYCTQLVYIGFILLGFVARLKCYKKSETYCFVVAGNEFCNLLLCKICIRGAKHN